MMMVASMAVVISAADPITIGAAGYSWDFTDPTEIEGFTLTAAEVDDQKDGIVNFHSTPRKEGERHDTRLASPKLALDASKVTAIVIGVSAQVSTTYGDMGAYLFFNNGEKGEENRTVAYLFYPAVLIILGVAGALAF